VPNRSQAYAIVMAALIAVLASALRAEQSLEGRVLFNAWLTAVARHAPGSADDPVTTVGRWNKGQLLEVLNHPGMNTSGVLRRGAMLHVDVALLGEAVATGYLFPVYDRNGPGPPPHPFLILDGTGVRRGVSQTHLEFARALIAKLSPQAKATYGTRWYAVTAALLALRRNFSDLAYHLEVARLAVPSSPELLLAAGCLHEMFAGSMAQAAQKSSPRVQVGDRDDNLRRAETYFSRALAQNPDVVEALLRRGRVRGQLNRHGEAVLDLQRARRLTADRHQSYYIRLFLGREEELLGRIDEARLHFEAAAALFPHAQSPRVSLSRLAADRGDMSRARQALDDGLRTEPGDYADDPWWIYDLGPGRYASAMAKELYELTLREES
jgi:hypothetical protein